MTQSDPWAAVSNSAPATTSQQSNSNNSQKSTSVAANAVSDMANPFATTSQAQEAAGAGGAWDPRVPFDVIEGRMCIMVPKSFRDDAPIPAAFNPKEGEVRDEWRVDLIVLDGGPFSFEYNFKANKEAQPEKKTYEVTELPSTHRGQTIAQGQLIRALNGANKEGKFLFGVMTMVPQLRDVKLYPTPEALAEARKAWIAALGAGQRGLTEPRYTWSLDDRPQVLTQERMNLAAQWWEQEKARRVATAS